MTTADKLTRLKTDFDDVYNKGYENGKAEGGNFYDAFWDTYQLNGERTYYSNAFDCTTIQPESQVWTDKNIKPKYDLHITSARSMFQYNTDVVYLKELFENQKRIFDTSLCTDFVYMFRRCISLKSVPALDVSSASGLESAFAGCTSLESVELTNVHAEMSFGMTFSNCMALQNIVIEGEIAKTIAFASSAYLTNESAKTILTHLVNYSGTENEFTYSVLFHIDVWARLDAEGNTAPDGTTWRDYVDNIGWNA